MNLKDYKKVKLLDLVDIERAKKNKVYEKEIIENNATTRVKYDLDHETIEILYVHNSYTEKIFSFLFPCCTFVALLSV